MAHSVHSVGNGVLSPPVKRSGRDNDHWPVSSPKVKYEWKYTSTYRVDCRTTLFRSYIFPSLTELVNYLSAMDGRLTDGTHNFLAVAIIIDATKTERPLITTVSTTYLPYCVESQHPPGHFVTAVMLRDTTEDVLYHRPLSDISPLN